MKILVTGGAGYIGSHTVNLLLAQGFDVTIVDNLSTGQKAACPKDVRLEVIDIRDENKILACLNSVEPDAIMHFAGKISVPESFAKPLDYFETNTFGTLTLLKAANLIGVESIVFSSTAAVYGDVQEATVREDAPLCTINPYGHSKAAAEQIVVANSQATGMKFGILRYFNVAGAAADGQNGQRSKSVAQLIHVASEAALGMRPHLSVFGTDYNTPDGTCVRDFIHVDDLAAAHLATLRYLFEGGSSTTFNVGYGHGSSVLAVIEAMKKVSGVDFPVRFEGRRPGDPAKVIAENGRIKKFTDWSPEHDDLDFICRSSLNWLRGNL
jgi:UDP-glucose 4-epimerase